MNYFQSMKDKKLKIKDFKQMELESSNPIYISWKRGLYLPSEERQPIWGKAFKKVNNGLNSRFTYIFLSNPSVELRALKFLWGR